MTISTCITEGCRNISDNDLHGLCPECHAKRQEEMDARDRGIGGF